MVLGGAFTIQGRGVVVYGAFIGALPLIGAPLVVVRDGEPPLRMECIGIEDMRRSGGLREFGLLVTGIHAEMVSAGDQICCIS